ncbi:inositol phosphorylceramide synthase [Candidatus Saccharibacteria bacterium]|nr:inositol phosphorylceramide synthase [Candidatus Saccharibacteria bacterium]
MKRTKKDWIIDGFILLATFAVANLYFILNAPSNNLYSVKTFIDDLIPRIPIFVVPYLLFLPWLWSIVVWAWLKNRSFRQLALALTITNLIAYAVYAFWQTVVPREVIAGQDIYSNLLQFVYNKDLPYAGFPSLHCGLSTVAATYFLITKSRLTGVMMLVAGLIVISTLLTKQHFFLDAVAGVILGYFVTKLVFRLYDY